MADSKKYSKASSAPDSRPNGRPSFPGNGPKPSGRSKAAPDAEPSDRGRRGERPAGGRETSFPGEAPSGAAGALISLDRDLMKLLVRRATLVSRIRGGRDHAATPAAIQAEKAVRVAWETGALAFSKDPRFSRQLFNLLQDMKVLSREQAEQTSSYNLSPPAKPVSGLLTGPASTRAAQMRLALAASLGKKLSLHPVMLCDALNDTVKGCEQWGVKISRTSAGPGLGTIIAQAGPAVAPGDRSIYLGEDPFNLYLMVFLSLGHTGVWRLNGGPRLQSADLSALRHILPLFGARLGHVVPRSQGLPANLECSGDIPPHILVPADLPPEALCALLLAPLVWNVPLTLDLSSLPSASATAALAEVGPLHRDSGAEVDTYGPKITFAPGPVSPPEEPALPLDPVLCAYLLCLPAFAGGGSLSLKGRWPARMPEAAEAEQLFAWAGLEFSANEDGVSAALPETAGDARPPFSLPMQNEDISPALGPLFLALAALCQKRRSEAVSLRQLLSFPAEENDLALAQDFFSRLGLSYEDGRLAPAPKVPEEPVRQSPDWTSPDAHWSMAFALAAFVRPGLRLANPGNVSELMPVFWGIYNALPSPVDPAGSSRKTKEEEKSDKVARRRVIAD